MHEVPRIRRFTFEGESIEADEVESLTDGSEVGFRQRPRWPIRGSVIGGRQPPDAHEVAIRCDQLWQHLGGSVTRSLRDGLEDVDFEDEVEGPDPFLRWLQKVGNNPFDVSIPCKGCAHATAVADRSKAVTRQPRSASAIASSPSPHPTTSARPETFVRSSHGIRAGCARPLDQGMSASSPDARS